MSELIGNLNHGEEKIPMTRENVTLYRHLGAHAVYDHLFVTTGESSGLYIWSHHSQYEELATKAVEAGAPLHLNIPEPAECDVKNLIAHQTADLEATDSFPEGWMYE